MGRKLFISFILNILLYSSVAYADTIEGPALIHNLSNWNDSGLQITALKNVTLENFVFQNQGFADTIWLTDSSGKILETYNYSGGETSHFVDVAWELSAHQSYRIIADQPSNGKYIAHNYLLNPVSNEHIQVDGNFQVSLKNGYWFNFNNITTVVPEPVSSILFLTGGGIMAFRHFQRK